MPTISQFPRTQNFDERGFRDDSQQLEEFRSKDFSSMDTELSQVIKHGGAQLRYIPLVWRVCRDLAIQYVRRPQRSFDGRASRVAALEDIYRRVRFDSFMLRTHQKTIGQTQQIVSFDYAGAGSERLRSWSPYEVSADFDDLLETDIRRASRVELLVPVGRSANTLHYGKRVYTQTEAYTEAGGQKVPLFGDSLAHGFGEVPLRMLQREDASRGWFFAPLPTDLLSVQIGLNIALSDIENICRTQCFARESLTGPGALVAAEQMQMGPDFMQIYPADAQHTVANVNPAVDKYMDAVKFTLELLNRNNYLPGDLTQSTGITGDAKNAEMFQMEEERERSEMMLEDFEQDVASLISMVVDRSPRSLLTFDAAPEVSLDFNYVEPRTNDLQRSQAREIDFAQGVDSVEEYVARTQGMSVAESTERVTSRLESYLERKAALGPVPEATAGLDRTAMAMGST